MAGATLALLFDALKRARLYGVREEGRSSGLQACLSCWPSQTERDPKKAGRSLREGDMLVLLTNTERMARCQVAICRRYRMPCRR